MITDGIISDMDSTKNAIVEAALYPISIIIVGVGEADFAAMDVLDGDSERLKNTLGKPADRDIVQFVPMRDFVDLSASHSSNLNSNTTNQKLLFSQARLAQEVLREIPTQVTEWMEKNKKLPMNLRLQQIDSKQTRAKPLFRKSSSGFIRNPQGSSQKRAPSYILET